MRMQKEKKETFFFENEAIELDALTRYSKNWLAFGV